MTKDIFKQQGKAGIEADIFAAAFEFRCPHLGSRNDPATALGYPNPANRCYKQIPPSQIDQPTQAEFCLGGNHVNCPIFLGILPPEEPEPEKGSKLRLPLAPLRRLRPKELSLQRFWPSGLSLARLRPKGDSVHLPRLGDNWKQRLRPALVVIPLIMLVIAALVWWPMPGTTVEDNTSRAAPLQKITAPAEVTPEGGAGDSGPVSGDDESPSTPEPAVTGQSPAAASRSDSAQELEPTPGYRVLSYD